MRKIILFSILALFSPIVLAAPVTQIHPSIALLKISAQKRAESSDEVYLAIAEFHSGSKGKYYTVPPYPIHWSSKMLSKIQDLKVWDGIISDGEGVELLISLMEHDAPPYNPDDLIGTVKVRLQYRDGQLHQEWSSPSKESEQKSIRQGKAEMAQFSLMSDNANYQLTFELKDPTNGGAN
ncbi:MAG: hypothetical protein CMF50_00170 [Legionellales bacterium]|nr:hypothetical protein [Legionellales bacterium]|tara:strand:- start:7696 stop:8235 length:540 start_codon:yes stop_codon:yes gene_type:complete